MNSALPIFTRLSNVEKSALRVATEGTVEHLANTSFVVDMPTLSHDERFAVLAEVKALVMLEFSVNSSRTDYGPNMAF